MRTTAILLGLALAVPLSAAWSHCQLPCGIYDDEARFGEIAEYIQTIERSMQQIEELSKADPPNYNQIVRWVNNKDEHADELNHVVTYYFMNQRVKPVDGDSPEYQDYVVKLTLLHKMMVAAMRAKQTTDLEYVEELKDLLARFKKAYTGK
jgi:nickel superoxide dismutase